MANTTQYSSLISHVAVSILFMMLTVLPCAGHSLDPQVLASLKESCPHLNPRVRHGMGLDNNMTGKREVIGTARNLDDCVKACCKKENCSIALQQGELCLALECHGTEDCHFVPVNESQAVSVRPSHVDVVLFQSNDTHAKTRGDNEKHIGRQCEVNMMECGEHGVCKPLGDRRRNGLCYCDDGYEWDTRVGGCVAASTTSTEKPAPGDTTNPSSPNSTSNKNNSSSSQTSSSGEGTLPPPPLETLLVNINNKTVELKRGSNFYEETVTLSAYAIGGTSNLEYEWESVARPDSDDTGSLTDRHSQTITLSHLSPGVYVFKVKVTAVGMYGQAVGNVTVKPAQHTNKPPKAIIMSPSQAIKLPTSGVIIDGSSSTDDDGIESYKWELVTAPLGYELKASEEVGPTLQLTDLIAGNYTIMLIVKDKEGLEGNATTSLTVIKGTDYPPTANAGGDQIIYLPQTETVLYGNLSTDDHGIKEWEWTKGPKDSGKAVDMQDTRTPFLRLSNLEEGHYQFILKVTDILGQSSNTSVYVYVQKPSLAAPQANAGPDIQIALPNTTVVLDGSGSSDTSSGTHWVWTLLSGPAVAHIATPGQPQTNVSGLTKGTYQFQLTVWAGDDPKKNSTDIVEVIVRQDHNVAPVANAGGDFSVMLPVSEVVVDGRKSSDDVAVTRWLWERDATSLAAGKVINESDHSPVLMFTGVVAGRYVWRLTVWDDQGASSSDTVSIIVKEGVHHLDEVTIVVEGDFGTLSTLQLSTLLQKLELFLHTAERVVTIHLISLSGVPHSGRLSVTFVANAGEAVVPGVEVVAVLRHQVLSDSSDLLDLPLISVDTVVCQNNCSGHGECVEATRECHCHTWWMESYFRRHFQDGMQNCDWSVVYVFVVVCLVVVAVGLTVWGLALLITRKCKHNVRPRRKPPRYSLLGSHDESMKLQTRPSGSLFDSGTESNSDVEIHFDSRVVKHRADKTRNGYHKLPRIRT